MRLGMGRFSQTTVNQSVREIIACQLVQFKVQPSMVSESGLFATPILQKRKIVIFAKQKMLKFRKCETPLVEPERARASPFPEGRDLG